MTANGPFTATIVSLFPESVRSIVDASILGRAQRAGSLVVEGVQIRDFATDKHRNVDGAPCGGGPGMVLKIDVLAHAIEAAVEHDEARGVDGRRRRVILLDAAGDRFTQADAERLAGYDHLVFVCGRYEGVDARVESLVDERLCIGDYVLTGGELGALVILDATARHRPQVLGNEASRDEESHQQGLLEHRQYTRPIEWRGMSVPDVLLSGDHGAVARARRRDQLIRTRAARPDLFGAAPLSDEDRAILDDDAIPTLDPAEKPS